MRLPISKRTTRYILPLAFASILVGIAAAPSPATAERSLSLLMTLDHHLLRADLIAEITVVQRTEGLINGEPLQQVTASLTDVWATRWSLGNSITFNTRVTFPGLEPGGRYIVLLSGGPWEQSPFTHRENSLFRIDPATDTVRCHDGSALFAVANDGFICAPDGAVDGTVITAAEMRDATLCARARSLARLPQLDELLASPVRGLQLEPNDGGSVQR